MPDTSFKWSCFAFSDIGRPSDYHSEELPKGRTPTPCMVRGNIRILRAVPRALRYYILVFRNIQSDSFLKSFPPKEMEEMNIKNQVVAKTRMFWECMAACGLEEHKIAFLLRNLLGHL